MGLATNGVVLYFHGSSSERDSGPSHEDAKAVGVRLVRNVRGGSSETWRQALAWARDRLI